MTANALQGERERCLAAGMDDYLPKPVRREDLAATLARWAPLNPAPHGDVAAEAGTGVTAGTEGATSVLDQEALNELLMIGDPSLLAEVAALLRQDIPARLAALRDAVGRAAAVAVAEAAHSLKGSAAVLGAYEVRDLCARLEVLGRTGSVEGAQPLLDALAPALERVDAALQSLEERDSVVGA
jgi:HPt (histidine-containing phosphotransfer) domain-containing protein